MSSNLPHFIQEHLVFVSDIHLSRSYRSTIALLSDLQLYELQDKQILNSIDLQGTVLNKVKDKIESIPPVLDSSANQGCDVFGSSFRCSNTPVGEIVLGKYVYQNRNLKIVYIILKCWNSLVIIERSPEGLTLEREYEGVESFEIVKGNMFESKLAILFHDSNKNMVTNLQKKATIKSKLNSTTHRKAEERIKMKQSELLVHKTITKKEFSKLKNSNVFGSNFVRTPLLDEMRILSKCSNAWLKINADEKLVIGVPLVNNCSARLTTLSKFRGLLQCSGNGDLKYTFGMYQQNTAVSSMENIKDFFETEASHYIDWSKCKELFLRPETFYVLTFEIDMKELVEFNPLEILLFASFELLQANKSFSYKCFLANLSFRDIFANDAYRINFHPSHMQRDLLSVISTSYKSDILLKYSKNDVSFREYLCNKMDFNVVSLPESSSEAMHVDDEETEVRTQSVLYYNSIPNSLWHGTLIAITKTCDNCSTATIYTKTQDKSIVFLRFLDIELRVKCGISDICYDCRNLSSKVVQFESLLRDECRSALKLFSSVSGTSVDHDGNKVHALYEDIYLMELKTNIWLKKLKS